MVHYLDTTQTHILPSLPNMLLCLQASRHPSELFYLREQGFGDFIFGVFKLFRVHPQHLSPTEPRCSVGVELSPSDSYFISLFLAYSLRLTTPTQFFKHTHTHRDKICLGKYSQEYWSWRPCAAGLFLQHAADRAGTPFGADWIWASCYELTGSSVARNTMQEKPLHEDADAPRGSRGLGLVA